MKRLNACVVTAAVLAACATPGPVSPIPDVPDLPETVPELIAIADRAHTRIPPQLDQIWLGWAALERARTKGDRSYALAWRLARGSFLLGERLPDKRDREHYARQGCDTAQAAIEANADRVEGHYYLALNLGNLADVTRDLGLVKPMVAVATRAAERDPTYDDAGALVFLGKTYLSAPGWPISVGDVEQAIECLERAVALRPTPLAQLFLGQAYSEDERYAEAATQLRLALGAQGSYALENKWRKEGEAALQMAEAEGTGTQQLQ